MIPHLPANHAHAHASPSLEEAGAPARPLLPAAPSQEMLDLRQRLRKDAPKTAEEARLQKAQCLRNATRGKRALQACALILLARFIAFLTGFESDHWIDSALPWAMVAGMFASFVVMACEADAQNAFTPVSELPTELIAKGLAMVEASPSARMWRDETLAGGRELLRLDLRAMEYLSHQDEEDAKTVHERSERSAMALKLGSPSEAGWNRSS